MKELLQTTTAYQLLKNESRLGRLSHTYLLLFNDDRNLSLALKEFAKLFFLEDDNAVRRIENGNFTDCLFYPEEGKSLDKDAVSAIIDESCLSPMEGQKKLFVLKDMHKASGVVQNKLLKVLEEPPRGVHFLLGATNDYSLLTTVRSRAKKLEIPPFSPRQIVSCLLRSYPDRSEEELTAFALASDGSVGKAQNLLEGGRYAELEQKAFACVSAPLGEIPSVSKSLQSVTEKEEFLSLLSELYRDMLMYVTGQERFASLQAEKKKVKELAKGFSAQTLVYALERVEQAEKEITFNANLSQCVEVCLLEIEKEKRKC